MRQAKPFSISQRQVWEAYKRVKANRGGAGVDGQMLEQFEQQLGDNVYKLRNRMASGSYMPLAVKRVEIPKGDGRVRPLGIPTVTDRVAQMVVKQVLVPEMERVFHADSYGYRGFAVSRPPPLTVVAVPLCSSCPSMPSNSTVARMGSSAELFTTLRINSVPSSFAVTETSSAGTAVPNEGSRDRFRLRIQHQTSGANRRASSAFDTPCSR